VLEIALEKPAFGQVRVANELTQRGLFVSPTGVRSVWLRHDLETFRKRLKALEAKAAQEHLVLPEEQLRALERAREEKEAHGEIETAHPGYGCCIPWRVPLRGRRSQTPPLSHSSTAVAEKNVRKLGDSQVGRL